MRNFQVYASVWWLRYLMWICHQINISRPTNDKSILVQVMAWCRQATSHYLSQYWPSSMLPYGITRPQWVYSLAPGRFDSDSKTVFFNIIIQNSSLGTCCEFALRWMPQNLINEKSTLFQVMAWCHQATSHCLSQCWPRSISPYGVIRPQWVKSLALNQTGANMLVNSLRPSDAYMGQ